MKKKLNLYSVLLAAVLIGWFISTHLPFSYNATATYDSEPQLEFKEIPKEYIAKRYKIDGNGIATDYKPVLSIGVPVIPKGEKVMILDKDGTKYRVDMQKASITIPYEYASTTYIIIVHSIIAIGVLIDLWFVFMFLRIIFRAYRGKILVNKIASDLNLAGKGLLILSLILPIVTFIANKYISSSHLSLGQYDVKLGYTDTFYYIIIALALMIVSQIILMGKELQEDQELTI